MADIHRVNGMLRAIPVEFLAPKSNARLRAFAGAVLADTPAADVELSDIGTVLSRMAATPGIRVGKVAKIRAAIAAGTYESAHKLDTVVERLLHELTR